VTRSEVFARIEAERLRQRAKFGDRAICGVAKAEPFFALGILTEEVGEVARSLLDSRGTVDKDELIQVAAVVVGWLEGLS
jgi:hypothetical protein